MTFFHLLKVKKPNNLADSLPCNVFTVYILCPESRDNVQSGWEVNHCRHFLKKRKISQ